MRALTLTFVFLTVACGGGQLPAPTTAAPEEVVYHPWSTASFRTAREERRIVLVDVGTEWCSACRWMEEGTYSDRRVARLLGERFLVVKVDAEVEPDVGQRFERWGWPALIFLSPEGERLLELRGNRRPARFLPILEDLVAHLDAGDLERRPAPHPPEPVASELAQLRATVESQLDGFWDPSAGGWGRQQKICLADPIELSLLRAAAGDDEQRERALMTLEQQTHMIDTQWGGIYAASVLGRWDRWFPEKITRIQAGALSVYARAYHATGDERWLVHVRALRRYLEEVQLSPEGTFYASQDDVPVGLPSEMTGHAYYELDDAARREFGVPPVDRTVYTDVNADVIAAYVAVYEATGDGEALAVARRAMRALVAAGRREAGWFGQIIDPAAGEPRVRPLANVRDGIFLRAQGRVGLALLALHGATAEARWLELAEGVAQATRTVLEDARGGFRSSDRPELELGAFDGRTLSLDDNATMARFLAGLAERTGDADHRAAAVRAVRAVGDLRTVRAGGRMVGGYALALAALTHEPVHLTVSGAADDAAAQALLGAAVRTYEPLKVVERRDPGERYPDVGHAVLYICTSTVCSPPVTEPGRVSAALRDFRDGGFGGGG